MYVGTFDTHTWLHLFVGTSTLILGVLLWWNLNTTWDLSYRSQKNSLSISSKLSLWVPSFHRLLSTSLTSPRQCSVVQGPLTLLAPIQEGIAKVSLGPGVPWTLSLRTGGLGAVLGGDSKFKYLSSESLYLEKIFLITEITPYWLYGFWCIQIVYVRLLRPICMIMWKNKPIVYFHDFFIKDFLNPLWPLVKVISLYWWK